MKNQHLARDIDFNNQMIQLRKEIKAGKIVSKYDWDYLFKIACKKLEEGRNQREANHGRT
jgi:hypothetical protein